MSYIITASGKLFYPLAPTVEMVLIEDIAASLSKQCRWTGHILGDQIYTVAQHAVTVSMLTDEGYELQGLHHDDSEAYLADVARPIKHTPGFMEIYQAHEDKLTSVIYEALGIPYGGKMHPSVKIADYRLLVTEARDLMPEPLEGRQAFGWDADPYDFQIGRIWSPGESRARFLERHNQLMELRSAA